MNCEDLPALAHRSFELAQTFCGDCRDYHASWGYVRAAGLRKGATAELAVLKGSLAGLADPMRVLIAGSADTGQLAALANALSGRRFQITLVDLCETPLALCREFATQHSIDFAAYQRDIAAAADLGPFDAVLFHNFLSFLTARRRNAMLIALRPALAARGRLVIVQRVAAQEKAYAKPIDGVAVASEVIRNLRAAGISLPEEESRFAARLAAASSNDDRERRLLAFSSTTMLENELRDAGYGDIQVTLLSQAKGREEERTAWRSPSDRYLVVAKTE
jgi:hypothetical protein